MPSPKTLAPKLPGGGVYTALGDPEGHWLCWAGQVNVTWSFRPSTAEVTRGPKGQAAGHHPLQATLISHLYQPGLSPVSTLVPTASWLIL